MDSLSKWLSYVRCTTLAPWNYLHATLHATRFNIMQLCRYIVEWLHMHWDLRNHHHLESWWWIATAYLWPPNSLASSRVQAISSRFWPPTTSRGQHGQRHWRIDYRSSSDCSSRCSKLRRGNIRAHILQAHAQDQATSSRKSRTALEAWSDQSLQISTLHCPYSCSACAFKNNCPSRARCAHSKTIAHHLRKTSA